MRWRRTRWLQATAGLGVVALACNAVVPVVLAFLLAAALAPQQRAWVQFANGNWRFIGALCRHDDTGGGARDHGKAPSAPCPVCSLHGALAITLPAPAPTPPDRVAAVQRVEQPISAARPVIVFAAAYRSRAPPRLNAPRRI